ncbi:hypothetical protein Patl1_08444 [Pistacia atlantica]|uniref:Uncharacterized protein n=1 Tax=Pistacia atlantica TaxID=434234 RepID=A0ACC1AKX7_9ROSI|nr:hypothetical protein Patl1_08444 [Pistacia atlantica]
MSEQASLFLTSIGLLGEYCPTSRKKNRHTSHKVGCMHVELAEANNTHCSGCQFMRPFPIAGNLFGRGGFHTKREAAAVFCPF